MRDSEEMLLVNSVTYTEEDNCSSQELVLKVWKNVPNEFELPGLWLVSTVFFSSS